MGCVSVAAVKDAVNQKDTSTLGEFLVSERLITVEQLLQALDRQIHERIVACFAIQTGKFNFIAGHQWADSVQVFTQSPRYTAWCTRTMEETEFSTEPCSRQLTRFVAYTQLAAAAQIPVPQPEEEEFQDIGPRWMETM